MPGRDADMSPLCWEGGGIKFWRIFACSVCWYSLYFLQLSTIKWIYFPIPVHNDHYYDHSHVLLSLARHTPFAFEYRNAMTAWLNWKLVPLDSVECAEDVNNFFCRLGNVGYRNLLLFALLRNFSINLHKNLKKHINSPIFCEYDVIGLKEYI